MANAPRVTIDEESLTRISLRELERIVHATDPAAVLVTPRILRRVIKQSAMLTGIGWQVPHRKSYVIGRSELLGIVDHDELDLPDGAELAETVILLARPSAERLVVNSAADNLTACWRLLFHARIHVAFDQQIALGQFGFAELEARLAQLGKAEFAEIRSVLRQENFLLPPPSDLATYVEFASLYLELRYFAPSFLPSYFPAIEDLDGVDELLAEDIDAEALFAATRLPGAPLAPPRRDLPAEEASPASQDAEPPPRGAVISTRALRRLLDRAARVSVRGNLVRAAILRVSAAQRGTPEQSRVARSEARADMERLADRLQPALGFDEAEREDWSRSLAVLTPQAARGFWTPEARLLYDLQKVCVDHERGVYTFDFYRWAKSGFRAPIHRPLPGQRYVLFSKHLRSAMRRLPAIRVSERIRGKLSSLLQAAVLRAEEDLRLRFRPTIATALDRVHLTPQNLPERVARDKLIDELLDRVVERGFLTMGDLRDALSRNNLKMPDVTSIGQLVLGDQLLKTNHRLADNLDGVYHRGEIYLTFPQRLSSLAFGTPIGRFLTQYVVLPFGGAFLIQKGLQHLIAPHAEQQAGFDTMSLVALFYIGFFLLGLLHHQGFRVICLDVLLSAGRLGRSLFIDLPRYALQLPVVQAIVHSLYFRLLQRGLFKPLVVTLLVVPILKYGLAVQITAGKCLGAFLIVNLLLNSRIGRNVDEWITDWVAQSWHRFRIRVLATFFRFIMEIFSRLLENIERMLYTVDEWLRFRTGESALSIGVKAVLGFVWFFVNYFIRFCVTLLIEPQINPIKHFPVVTVSHKILLPLAVPFIHVLEGPLGRVWADTVGGTIVLLLPGVFGFLVWELKENWRLYAANRPKNLGPATIGHHGESVLQFVKPGFRSGTLPKLFAKLRRANRKAYWTGRWKTVGKQETGLHHNEEYLRRFFDRDLLALLRHSHGWGRRQIESGTLLLATNRILAELRCPDLADEGLWLSFRDESGWLVASIHRPGWLAMLDATQRLTFDNALAGFYKMAGVDVVRDQLDRHLATQDISYDIDDAGLKVWPTSMPQDAVHYSLSAWSPVADAELPASFGSVAASVRPSQWIFARTPISWLQWVVLWNLDQEARDKPRALGQSNSLLPAGAGR